MMARDYQLATRHIRRVYMALLDSGWRRPNDQLRDLEAALAALGVSADEIEHLYDGAAV